MVGEVTADPRRRSFDTDFPTSSVHPIRLRFPSTTSPALLSHTKVPPGSSVFECLWAKQIVAPQSTSAFMASMPPQHEAPLRSSYELAPSSPPEPGLIHHMPRSSTGENFADPSSQYHNNLDFRKSDAARFTNGNGPLPMPNTPHPQMQNGGPRHGSTMSLGGFEGPRSPPAAKSP